MVFISLTRPSRLAERRAMEEGARAGYNYSDVGATRIGPSLVLQGGASASRDRSYAIDHTRVRLGSGADDFSTAKTALLNWSQFQLGWTYVDAATPIEAGALVCVCARTFAVWSRNPLRIVFVDTAATPMPPANGDAKGKSARSGGAKRAPRERLAFAHGTLGGHMLAGEERFSVEHDAEGAVWYEVFTFSRPGSLLSALAYPLARMQQKRFARDSAAAMQRAVASGALRSEAARAVGGVRGGRSR